MSLPQVVQQYENYKRDKSGVVPNVDFRYLDSLGLDKEGWIQVARNGNWMFTRMNLNTFARHGVFESAEMVDLIAKRLRDKEQIAKAKAFPYQLLMAWKAAGENVPAKIGDALHDAMEYSIYNVPEVPGKIYICVDTSGSMGSPVTGNRFGGHSSAARCVDVAALFACALFRKNRDATIIPFDTQVYSCNLNPRDTVMTNAQVLARYGGGGTSCSLPLAQLNQQGKKGDAVIYVSDNESWVDRGYGSATGVMSEWIKFRDRNKKAKLVCIDLTPSPNSQVKENKCILQVGGFSDACFDVVSAFIKANEDDPDYWVREIEKVSLEDDRLVVPETDNVEEVADGAE
jgi:60 kDa SS-A/Ro ribonucleoprotein